MPSDLSELACSHAIDTLPLLDTQTVATFNSTIFTSGTAGKPKATVLTNANLHAGGACLGR